MRLRLWRSPRLATRIAMAIVLVLVAVQVVNLALFLVLPPRQVSLYDAGWLAQAAVEARQTAASAVADRLERLSALEASRWLDFGIEPSRPETDGPPPPWPVSRLRPTLASMLAGQGVDVIVSLAPGRDPPPVDVPLGHPPDGPPPPGAAPPEHAPGAPLGEPRLRRHFVQFVPPDLPSTLEQRRVDADERGVLMPPTFFIALSLPDGSWLTVRPKADGTDWRGFRTLALVVSGLVLIAVLSIWTARGLVRPLERLAAAAELLGRERQLTLIAEPGVPEFAVIAHAFNEMQVRLKRFVDERIQMLAAISHDLRTPLTRLRLHAEFLADEAHRRQVLASIEEMEAMIEASLTFARHEANREAHALVDVASLLISLCDNVSDSGGQATYTGPDHASLRCQPVALRRALANLVDNACKYGGSVALTLQDRQDAIVVTVADEGPGIPPEQVELAFTPFQRLESSRNRDTGGTGLGLTIARDIIRGHGGGISLANGEPSGLIVTVTLPKPHVGAPAQLVGAFRKKWRRT